MFFSALVQYNSSATAVSANLRFRWEYQPGSELFVVYNEARDTLNPALSASGEPGVRGQDQPALPLLIQAAARKDPHGAVA